MTRCLLTAMNSVFSSLSDGSENLSYEILTRGFIYVKEAEAMMDELMRVTLESVNACEQQHITDWSGIKTRVKSNLSGYLFKTTRRSPMILPVITEI